ncbi:MAG: NAD(P)H-dependent oxidoreductase [Clostridia bacterium]|nr:NAD(P)H-dependent oxidoreductase [Clostridia bacterium]
MRISVILGHPNKKSFVYAIAETTVNVLNKNGHDVRFHDLFEENFDPVITGKELVEDDSSDPLIRKHCMEIQEAEGIIIIHPNWWGQPPAILKGWIDRIMRPGIAYTFDQESLEDGIPQGLLKAGAAVVFNTSNTPLKRELEVFGDPLETIWKNCVFDFCGVKNFYRKNFGVVSKSTPEERQSWLNQVETAINQYFPRKYE